MSRPQLSQSNLTRSGPPSSSSATSSPRPGWGQPRPTPGRQNAPGTPSSSSSPIPSQPAVDLSQYLGLPLRLTLTNHSEPVTGRLFSHEPSFGLVILETDPEPSSTPLYPPSAAAAPTQRRTQAVHAAQGGASQASPTGFKLIKERLIKDVTVLDAAAVLNNSLSPVTPVNVAVAEKREQAASKEAALRASRIGVGVTENGQDVFEALSKTLPCRWHEKHIIVMDEVILSEPYDVSSLQVPKYSTALLEKLTDDSSTDESLTSQLPQGESLSTARGKARSWQRVSRVLDGERRKIAARRAVSGGGS